MKPWKSVLSLLFCCMTLTACKHVQVDRFFVDARINDKPVRLAYDTGAEASVIFSSSARRVGLKEVDHPEGKAPPGKVLFGRSELCRFDLGSEAYRLKLTMVRIPWWWGLDVDGTIGWPDMIDDFLEINARKVTIHGLTNLPDLETNWTTLSLYPHTKTLSLALPRTDGKTGVMLVDTGNPDGVSLSPERWQQWRKDHPHAKSKWSLGAMPGSGLRIERRYIATNLVLGPLTFTNVDIRKANSSEMSGTAKPDVFEASIGFQALKQLRFVADRKSNSVHIQPVLLLTEKNKKEHRKPPAAGTATNNFVHLKFREYQYLDCAMDAFQSGKYEEAITNGEKFSALEPTNTQAMAWLGNVNYQAGAQDLNRDRLEQAVKHLTHALALRPQWAEPHFLRGNAHYLLHQRNDAVQDYRRFCELRANDNAYAHFFIWMIRNQSGEKEAADAELADFLDQNKKTIDAHQMEVGNFLLGRLDEASFLRDAKAQDARHPDGAKCEAWFYAGLKQQLAGNPSTAKDYFQKCAATGMKDYIEYNFATAGIKESNESLANAK